MAYFDNGKNNTLISGTSGNDYIKNREGSNVSINAGKGNDTLYGNDGADTFIYAEGDGKDVIFGFGDDDLLKITGTFSATFNKSKGEVYFKVGTTSKAITLKNFTATTFNVNGTKLVRS